MQIHSSPIVSTSLHSLVSSDSHLKVYVMQCMAKSTLPFM